MTSQERMVEIINELKTQLINDIADRISSRIRMPVKVEMEENFSIKVEIEEDILVAHGSLSNSSQNLRDIYDEEMFLHCLIHNSDAIIREYSERIEEIRNSKL